MYDPSAQAKGLEAIEGQVTFVAHSNIKPVTYLTGRGEGDPKVVGTFEDHRVTLYDARPKAREFSMDVQGFAITRHPTRMTDFEDEQQITQVYYPEVIDFVRQWTGAELVHIFDHTIRIEDVAKREARQERAPVAVAHNDYTEWSGPQRVRDLLPKAEAEERLKHRFVMLNVWRPLQEPVLTYPLVLCDAKTTGPTDLIASDHVYKDRKGEIYRMAYGPEQKWYYFSNMMKNEVVLIKCFDSLRDGRARMSGHGAAQLSARPAGAIPRESIEVRTIAFFPPDARH